MFGDYQLQVLRNCREKKDAGILSLNILHSTSARLRKECMVVLSERYRSKDEVVLKSFFGAQADVNAYMSAIRRSDADLFKPLDNFLKGNTADTSERNIELLAWLIDFEPRPYQVGFNKTKIDRPETVQPTGHTEKIVSSPETGKQELWGKRPLDNKTFLYLGLFALLCCAGYLIWMLSAGKQQGCMVWTVDRYVSVSCNPQPDLLILPLDTARMIHFRKIMKTDTITERSAGKLWYSKINNNVEFFTTPGFHPVHIERRLKPATLYMINKYAGNKQP